MAQLFQSSWAAAHHMERQRLHASAPACDLPKTSNSIPLNDFVLDLMAAALPCDVAANAQDFDFLCFQTKDLFGSEARAPLGHAQHEFPMSLVSPQSGISISTSGNEIPPWHSAFTAQSMMNNDPCFQFLAPVGPVGPAGPSACAIADSDSSEGFFEPEQCTTLNKVSLTPPTRLNEYLYDVPTAATPSQSNARARPTRAKPVDATSSPALAPFPPAGSATSASLGVKDQSVPTACVQDINGTVVVHSDPCFPSDSSLETEMRQHFAGAFDKERSSGAMVREKRRRRAVPELSVSPIGVGSPISDASSRTASEVHGDRKRMRRVGQAPDSQRSERPLKAKSKRARALEIMMRRDTHNDSERQRRINMKDGMLELKAVLPPHPDMARMNTGQLLEYAVACIHALEHEEKRLVSLKCQLTGDDADHQ